MKKRTTRQDVEPGVMLYSGPYKGAKVEAVSKNGWAQLSYPDGYTGPCDRAAIRVNWLQLDEKRIVKNMFTLDELFQGNPVFYTESVIASQQTQRKSKELRLRVTINAESHAIDGMYHVCDCNQRADQQIQLITSDLVLAVERYNEI